LLTHPILFNEQGTYQSLVPYSWSELAQRFVKRYPHHSLVLLDSLLQVRDNYRSLVNIRSHYGPIVAAKIIKQDPEGAWKRIANLLDGDLHSMQAWHIGDWLGGDYNFGEEEPGAIILFPPQLLWDWVNGNKSERSLWLAKTMPLSLDPAQGGRLTHEFLVRYGDDQKLSGALMARFVLRGYSGPESAHYQRLRDQGRKWLATETVKTVREWIERYVASFHDRIRTAEIQEERED
jgi:hypothetical protein